MTLQELWNIAIEANLDEPFGRAVALMNRRYNDGGFAYLKWDREALIQRLSSFKTETAVRWREHWERYVFELPPYRIFKRLRPYHRTINGPDGEVYRVRDHEVQSLSLRFRKVERARKALHK